MENALCQENTVARKGLMVPAGLEWKHEGSKSMTLYQQSGRTCILGTVLTVMRLSDHRRPGMAEEMERQP